MSSARCPKCGAIGHCYCRNIEEISGCDLYTFFCPKCGYIEKRKQYGASPVFDDCPTRCPFCNELFSQHSETPEELWFVTSLSPIDPRELNPSDFESL